MRVKTRLCEMQHKEIVNLKDGSVLAYADDLLISTETAQVESLIVCGRPLLLGLFGRQPDLVIPWDSIQTIGEDAILVSVAPLPAQAPPKRAFSWKKWREFWGA